MFICLYNLSIRLAKLLLADYIKSFFLSIFIHSFLNKHRVQYNTHTYIYVSKRQKKRRTLKLILAFCLSSHTKRVLYFFCVHTPLKEKRIFLSLSFTNSDGLQLSCDVGGISLFCVSDSHMSTFCLHSFNLTFSYAHVYETVSTK